MSFTPSGSVTATEITALGRHLTGLGTPDSGVVGGELIDQLRALEELKASVAAAQVRVTVAFAHSQQRQAEQSAIVRAGEPGGFEAWQAKRDTDRCRPSVGAQIGLARRLSPYQGAAQLSIAQSLVDQLPGTLAALTAGVLSECRAAIIARESSWLTPAERGVLDREVTTNLTQLASWGDKELTHRVRALAYRLDAHTAVERAARATADRRVSLRPKPDLMCGLSALLTIPDGVAVHSALDLAATTARAGGDPRSRGQVMADTLVQRVTGHPAGRIPVEVQLVLSDTTLLGADHTPASVPGYGPVPAALARDLIASADRDAKAWLRRLYAHPDTGALTQVESTRRIFPKGLRRLITSRDQTCRTPWCDAPIRHLDHIHAHAHGGKTDFGNGQGLCERCNYTKQTPRWASETLPGDPGQAHHVRVTTPTGHTYHSHAPPVLPGLPPPRPSREVDAFLSPWEATVEYTLSA